MIDFSKYGHGAGTWLESDMYLSLAWLSLGQKGTAKKVSSCSAQILTIFLSKRDFDKKRVRTDNNQFSLSYKEAETYGISAGMRLRAIDELLAKGFIEVAHQGGACEKDVSLYSLVDDWLGWVPGMTCYKRPKDVKRGFQGKRLGATKKHNSNKHRTR